MFCTILWYNFLELHIVFVCLRVCWNFIVIAMLLPREGNMIPSRGKFISLVREF